MLMIESADHQRKRFTHRGDVGRDVEGVGGDQQENQRQHQPARRDLHDICGEALAGDPADPALTSWIAIMNGVVRNTVQSRP